MGDSATYWLTLRVDEDLRKKLWSLSTLIEAYEDLAEPTQPTNEGRMRVLAGAGMNVWCEDGVLDERG